MNITEYSKTLKSKVAQLITNWDKLTINQLEQIERIVNNIMPPAEEQSPTKRKRRCYRIMTEEIYKEVMNLRSLGWKWKDIAKKFDYSNTGTLYNSVNLFKAKHNSGDLDFSI